MIVNKILSQVEVQTSKNKINKPEDSFEILLKEIEKFSKNRKNVKKVDISKVLNTIIKFDSNNIQPSNHTKMTEKQNSLGEILKIIKNYRYKPVANDKVIKFLQSLIA